MCYPNSGESNGREHGKCNGNRDDVVVYMLKGFLKIRGTFCFRFGVLIGRTTVFWGLCTGVPLLRKSTKTRKEGFGVCSTYMREINGYYYRSIGFGGIITLNSEGPGLGCIFVWASVPKTVTCVPEVAGSGLAWTRI